MSVFNARHFLRHISMPTLQEFTDAHSLVTSLSISWAEPQEVLPTAVCDAVDALESLLSSSDMQPPERDALEQNLHLWHDDLRRAHLMSNALSIKRFQLTCASDPEVLEAFAIRDAKEQSLWMLTFRKRAFKDAELHIAFQANANGKFWKKHRIQPGLNPTTDGDKLKAFGQGVAKLYKKVGGGDGAHIEVSKHPGTDNVQLTIYVEGPITALAHFSENIFKRVTTRIALETALVYEPSTGFLESVVKGGTKNHGAVLELFGKHIVEQTIDPEEVEKTQYKLNELRDGLEPFEDWSIYGVDTVRLRRAKFTPVGRTGISFQIEASAERHQDDAVKLARMDLKTHHSFESEYNLSGATLLVYLLPRGERRAGQFSFDLQSTGYSTIKNLSQKNQPIANAVLQSLNVIDVEEAGA
jgi:hypothetical protein